MTLSKPAVEVPAGPAPTDLEITDIAVGDGPEATPGQRVSVQYVGVAYSTGKEFDSSWSRNEEFTTNIGVGSVIPGWDQGLVGKTVGSRVQLDIPADLAYGTDTSSGQPAGDLRFVVDILAAA